MKLVKNPPIKPVQRNLSYQGCYFPVLTHNDKTYFVKRVLNVCVKNHNFDSKYWNRFQIGFITLPVYYEPVYIYLACIEDVDAERALLNGKKFLLKERLDLYEWMKEENLL